MASSNQKRMDALLFILKDELDQQWREDQAIIKQRQEEKRRSENLEPVPAVQKPKWENTRKRTVSPAASTDHKVVVNNKRNFEEELKFGIGEYQSSGCSNGFTSGKNPIRVSTGKGKGVMETEVEEGGDDNYQSRSSVFTLGTTKKDPQQQKATTKMKKTKRVVIRARNPEPEPDMPAQLREHITKNKEGHDIKLVIQKFMHSSDLVRNNNRFSIPMAQIREPFLSQEEEHYFQEKMNNKMKERDVTVIEPSLCETVLTFKRWNMVKKDGGKTSSSYVLIRSWMKVVERNRFRKDDLVQLWSFRVGSELNFAMVVVRRANQRDNASCSEDN